MSRHNDALGAGYDAWKTTPPDDDDREPEYTYQTSCCGAEVEDEIGEAIHEKERVLLKAKGVWVNWTPEELDSVAVICAECKELSEVVRHEPAEPFDPSDDCAGGGDGPED